MEYPQERRGAGRSYRLAPWTTGQQTCATDAGNPSTVMPCSQMFRMPRMPFGSSVLSPTLSAMFMYLLMTTSLSTALCPDLDPHSSPWVLGSGLSLPYCPPCSSSQSVARGREAFSSASLLTQGPCYVCGRPGLPSLPAGHSEPVSSESPCSTLLFLPLLPRLLCQVGPCLAGYFLMSFTSN